MEITLYEMEGCPFCKKVSDFMTEKGVAFTPVIVAPDRANAQRQELAQKSGVGTVPVAQIDGEYIGDSAAIIEKITQKLAE